MISVRTSPEASVNKSSSNRIDVSEKVLESGFSRFMAIHDQPNDNFGTLGIERNHGVIDFLN